MTYPDEYILADGAGWMEQHARLTHYPTGITCLAYSYFDNETWAAHQIAFLELFETDLPMFTERAEKPYGQSQTVLADLRIKHPLTEGRIAESYAKSRERFQAELPRALEWCEKERQRREVEQQGFLRREAIREQQARRAAALVNAARLHKAGELSIHVEGRSGDAEPVVYHDGFRFNIYDLRSI